jgi:exopolysaccharide biosynthesis protein
MAALMKSLGCRRAMMLDGGLSSQLAVRGRTGLSQWKNWRAVPLGLIALPATP